MEQHFEREMGVINIFKNLWLRRDNIFVSWYARSNTEEKIHNQGIGDDDSLWNLSLIKRRWGHGMCGNPSTPIRIDY